MGLEASCTVTWGKKSSAGTAQLESNELRFAGDFRLKIPFTAINAFEAKGDALRVTFTDGVASFALGAPQAEKWALKIRYPRGRLDKLGIKPESIVSVIGVDEPGFHDELTGRAASITRGKAARESHIIVFGAREVAALAALPALRASLVPDGGLWVVWPKGQKALREDDVRAAAKDAGLVDVKVMSFSDTLSGLKLVIPVALRGALPKPAAAKKTSASATKAPARDASATKTPKKAPRKKAS